MEHRQQWHDVADDEGRLSLRTTEKLFASLGKTGIDARKLFRDAHASPQGKVGFADYIKFDQTERLGSDPTKTAASAFKTAESMFRGFAQKRRKCGENIAIDKKNLEEIENALELPTYRRNMIADSLKEKQTEYAAIEDMYDKLLQQQVNMKRMLKGGFPVPHLTNQLAVCAHTGKKPSKKPAPPPPMTLPRLVGPRENLTRKCPRTARYRGVNTTARINKQTFNSTFTANSLKNASGSQTARF